MLNKQIKAVKICLSLHTKNKIRDKTNIPLKSKEQVYLDLVQRSPTTHRHLQISLNRQYCRNQYKVKKDKKWFQLVYKGPSMHMPKAHTPNYFKIKIKHHDRRVKIQRINLKINHLKYLIKWLQQVSLIALAIWVRVLLLTNKLHLYKHKKNKNKNKYLVKRLRFQNKFLKHLKISLKTMKNKQCLTS